MHSGGAVRLGGFIATRPRFEIEQDASLDWLSRAHAAAEARHAGLGDEQQAVFAARIRGLLRRCACQAEQLARRGHSVADVGRAGFKGNRLYAVDDVPRGRGTAERMRLFEEIVDEYFHGSYSADEAPPDDLIHVTCTGYASPSAAQKLVAARGWGARTRVTHAYHMGCYASLPALRLAEGFAALGGRRVDIVHTELCSLHLDPLDHRLEQLVVQSLFADGLIRYSLGHRGAGLDVLARHEVVVADSAGAMSWRIGDHGMQMSLARDVSERIGGVLRAFLIELYGRAGLDIGAARDSVFAVHPGGPRILDGVAATLELRPEQLAASRGVLHDFGNMSSATLPHIWMRLLGDPRIADGTLVPSLAFGPGLTVCGTLLVKRC